MQPFQTATLVVLELLVAAQVSMACSWDYPIWQVRKKNADPIYRFVQNEKAGYIDRAGNVIIQPTLWTYGNNGYEFEDGLLHVGVTDSICSTASSSLFMTRLILGFTASRIAEKNIHHRAHRACTEKAGDHHMNRESIIALDPQTST